MIDKILRAFFVKKKTTKCITVLTNREMKNMPLFYLKNKNNKQIESKSTCLSKYFSERKGLNLKEREIYSNNLFGTGYQR